MTAARPVDEFWQSFLDTLSSAARRDRPDSPDRPDRPDRPDDVFGFGDSPGMADELGHLVAAGEKTATASALWPIEHGVESMPTVGDLSVVLDGSGDPLCVIETVTVDVVPFDEVDEEFARAEGEGFVSVADWREAHWNYYSRTLRHLDLEPTQEMPVVCERFRVVYPELSA